MPWFILSVSVGMIIFGLYLAYRRGYVEYDEDTLSQSFQQHKEQQEEKENS